MKIRMVENDEVRRLSPVEYITLRTALRNLRVGSTLAMDTAKKILTIIESDFPKNNQEQNQTQNQKETT